MKSKRPKVKTDKSVPQLEVSIGKIRMKNPVMVASGTFGYGREFEDLVDIKRLGAIVTKSITMQPREGNSPPRVAETACGMLNGIGLQNDGLKDFVEEKMFYLKTLGTPVIVSIAGQTPREFINLARRLDSVEGLDGLELNISCPNVKSRPQTTVHRPQKTRNPALTPPLTQEGFLGGTRGIYLSQNQSCGAGQISKDDILSYAPRKGHGLQTMDQGLIAQDAKATYDVVKAVRRVTRLTLITKLSPNVTDIAGIAKSAEDAGTDAVSLINTFIGMAIDVQERRPKLSSVTGGLSGPCIKPLALRMVWEVFNAVKIPIIGMGGIMDSEDALEFIVCGATAIAVGTANLVNPKAPIQILSGIKDYLRRNRIKDIMSLTGSLQHHPP